MSFDYHFDFAAIVIASFVILDILVKGQSYRRDARYFVYFALSQILMSLADVFCCVMLNMPEASLTIKNVGCVFYYYTQANCIMLFEVFMYVYATPKIEGSLLKSKYLNGVLFTFLCNAILAILSPFLNFYFRIDETGAFVRGDLNFVCYIFYIVAVLQTLFFVSKRQYAFIKNEKWLLTLSCIVMCAAMAFQLVKDRITVISFGLSIIILVLYVGFENPGNYKDKLTGCHNAAALKAYINNWNPTKDQYTVLFIDIVHFQSLVSAIGHTDADELVRKVTRFIKRDMDMVRFTYRVGENTIAVIVKGGSNEMKPVAERIRKRFEEKWELHDGDELELEGHFIVATFDDHFSDYVSMVELKNYMAKSLAKKQQAQRTSVAYASEELFGKWKRYVFVENTLRDAITKNTLEVYYQPIYDDSCRQVVALEALSRLKDVNGNFISPEEFVPIAEETGLVVEMGKLVFRKVCRFIHDKLLTMENCTVKTVEVNLSPIQLMYPHTIDDFEKMISDYRIPAQMINFEITESATADSPETVLNAMQQLMDHGARFSLDDYGTGYSNISYLVHFPFDLIKFDKELVWSYFGDEAAHIIMEKEFEIIGMLEKDIVAEGIETEEQFYQLKNKKVRFFQGYYFSKPLPPKECVAYLENPTPARMFI